MFLDVYKKLLQNIGIFYKMFMNLSWSKLQNKHKVLDYADDLVILVQKKYNNLVRECMQLQ